MMKLNPHAKSVKRAEMLTVERRRAAKEAVLSKKRREISYSDAVLNGQIKSAVNSVEV